MRNSKLLDIIQLLTPKERIRLQELVYSPYYNKHQNSQKLLSYLLEIIDSDADSGLFSKEAAFAHLFPNESYDVQRIKDVMSLLTKLVEQYLQLVNYEKEPIGGQLCLLRELRSRNAGKYFEQAERLMRQSLEKTKDDSERHRWGFELESEADTYFMSQSARAQHESIQHRSNHLDRYYLLNKLRVSCEMINRSNIVKVKYDMPFLDEACLHLDAHHELYADEKLLLAYYRILKALTEPENEAHYSALINYLNENVMAFDANEARGMYDYAKNYCIKKINSGKSEYLQRLFEVYKALLHNKVIYQNGILTEWDYKNIVTVATRQKEFDWCHEFIEYNRPLLDPAQRDNAYTYNLAMLHYSRNQLKEAMILLRDVEFTDLYYGLGAKTTLLKTYYELDELDAFFNMIDTFRTFLKRNKLISEYQFKVNSNLLKFAKKLATLKNKKGVVSHNAFDKELQALQKSIASTKEITNVDWLKQKMGELS